MNRKTARQVAKMHGVSVKEVRAGVQNAIDHAYENPNLNAQNVKCKGEKPTADELISHLAQQVEGAIKLNNCQSD